MVLRSRHITKVDKRDFLKSLGEAVIEKDVEIAYRGIIEKYYGGKFVSIHGTDGYLEPEKDSLLANEKTALRLLLEAKWQKNFEDGDRLKLIAQAIYYLKKFKESGEPLPNVLLGGDENEMFTIYAKKLYKYLNEDYDWTIPPSSAYENEALLRALEEDHNIKDIVVYRIDKEFDIDDVFKDINALCSIGEFEKLKVNEANLRKTFDRFVRLVFGGDKWLQEIRRIGTTESVSIFIRSILGNNDIYIHPNKPNILVSGHDNIVINGAAYHAFFSRYDRRYTSKEIDKITAVADQLIEELDRRFKGDFWTPTIWADEAIRMMERDLGEDFREKYVVWDPAAGTKNLTRDYKFKNLFSSTIHQSEIDMSKQYNPEATSFQYDFLNDDIDVNPNSDPRDLKMPRELFEALKSKKPIIFYTNPPYGHPGTSMGVSKAGVSKNRIGEIMNKNGFKNASEELYCQFIFRIQKLTNDFDLQNVHFFYFFNKGFLTSPAYGSFTEVLLSQFRFNDGFMFNAGEFQGTSSAWGIIFSNFSKRVDGDNAPVQNQFDFIVKKSSAEGDIEDICAHTLYRTAKEDVLSKWLSEQKVNRSKEETQVTMNGPFSFASSFVSKKGENSIGEMILDGDAVQNSGANVYILSTGAKKGNNRSVIISPNNFERACVVFSCRKAILPDASWINDKDMFRRPSDAFQQSPTWTEFVRDCIVFSIFHPSSLQTSIRQFGLNGKYYNIYNEWFFMSTNEIIKLADEFNLNDISFDARNSDERFVYRYLHGQSGRRINLSIEAQELLNAGELFIRKCFSKRYITNMSHPEWHLMTWDAGYFQSYKVFSENKSDAEIAEAYSVLEVARSHLESKIRHAVYRDGILKKDHLIQE